MTLGFQRSGNVCFNIGEFQSFVFFFDECVCINWFIFLLDEIIFCCFDSW